MLKEILPKLSASPHSAIKILEDIRLLLGLSQQEIVSALLLLEKADLGSLHFSRGNTEIRFDSMHSDRLNCSDICIELEVREEDLIRSVKYNIPRTYMRLVKRKSFASNSAK